MASWALRWIFLAVATVSGYERGAPVPLWVDKVGPLHNPQEVYDYVDLLPPCTVQQGGKVVVNAASTPHAATTPAWRHHFYLWKPQQLGEYLNHEWQDSGYSLLLGNNQDCACTPDGPLTKAQVERLAHAIHNSWTYDWVIDDLPLRQWVGALLYRPTDEPEQIMEVTTSTSEEDRQRAVPYVYSHRTLILQYTEDGRIDRADLQIEKRLSQMTKVQVGANLTWHLTVFWQQAPPNVASSARWDRLLDNLSQMEAVRRMSKVNNLMISFVLVCFVVAILYKSLRKDFQRLVTLGLHDSSVDVEGHPTKQPRNFAEIEWKSKGNLERERLNMNNWDRLNDQFLAQKQMRKKMIEREGCRWTVVRGDVFRAPPQLPLLASLVGLGAQVGIQAIGIVWFAFYCINVGEGVEERASVVRIAIAVFVVSIVADGCVSRVVLRQFGYTGSPFFPWVSVLASWPVFISLVLTVTSIAAEAHGSINRFPIPSVLKYLGTWLSISVPLCYVGYSMGKQIGLFSPPCRVTERPRVIPVGIAWPKQSWVFIICTGLLNFSCIFIESFFLHLILWSKSYYRMNLLSLVSLLWLVINVASISCVVVFLSLSKEDYRWQWLSFQSGTCVGAYHFLYSIYYFRNKGSMQGALQATFFFGYMGLVAVGLALVCGAIAYASASVFVQVLYCKFKHQDGARKSRN